MTSIGGRPDSATYNFHGSMADFAIFIYTKVEEQHMHEVYLDNIGTIMQVFRIFRLLRVLKLVRSWENFNFFLETIANTLTKISSFTILLALFCFIYAMIGLEMLSHRARFDRANIPVKYFDPINPNTTSEKFSVPNSNFDSFFEALLSVFIVIANDGWTVIYWDYYRTPSVGPIISTIFFMSLVIFGQMILFNLFLAILLKEVEQKITIRRIEKSL